jgi:hypothetical protein
MNAKSGLASFYNCFACVSLAALLAIFSWMGMPPVSRYFHATEQYGTYQIAAGPARFSAAWLHVCTPLAGVFASLRRVSAPSGAGGFGDPAGSRYALVVGHAAQSAELYDVYVSVDGRNDSALRRVWIMQVGRESAYGPRCNA